MLLFQLPYKLTLIDNMIYVYREDIPIYMHHTGKTLGLALTTVQ